MEVKRSPLTSRLIFQIEQAQVKCARDQATAAEQLAANSKKQVERLEKEIDELRREHRRTPEAELMQQLMMTKGELADCERRLESMKVERNQVLQEKEASLFTFVPKCHTIPPKYLFSMFLPQNFRKDVHKLASALRREREKSKRASRELVKQNEQPTQQQPVRLSFDAQEKSFVIDGDEGEVAKILSDLNKISEAGVGTSPSGGVSLQTPLPKAAPGGFLITKRHNDNA